MRKSIPISETLILEEEKRLPGNGVSGFQKWRFFRGKCSYQAHRRGSEDQGNAAKNQAAENGNSNRFEYG